jgi:hypothetical protein
MCNARPVLRINGNWHQGTSESVLEWVLYLSQRRGTCCAWSPASALSPKLYHTYQLVVSVSPLAKTYGVYVPVAPNILPATLAPFLGLLRDADGSQSDTSCRTHLGDKIIASRMEDGVKDVNDGGLCQRIGRSADAVTTV